MRAAGTAARPRRGPASPPPSKEPRWPPTARVARGCGLPADPAKGLGPHPAAATRTGPCQAPPTTPRIHPRKTWAHEYRAATRLTPKGPQTVRMMAGVGPSAADLLRGRLGSAAKLGALPPQLESLPMDQRQHPPRPERPAQARAQQPNRRERLSRPHQRRDHAPVSTCEINPDADPVRPQIKPEFIAALDTLERRDVENLLRAHLVLRGDRRKIIAVAQIGMTVAIGVVDLGDDDANGIVVIPANPERYRVEHMAKDARLRQQLDLVGRGQVMGRQHLAHPRSAAPIARSAAMIPVPHRGQPRTIAPEQARASQGRFGIQQHIVNAIAKGVFHSPFAPMPCVARDMIYGGHSAATAGTVPREAIASATSIALDKPSS